MNATTTNANRMFISFEGLDGSGKSTQAKLLVEKLESLRYTVEFIREPGGTEISERIREILLDRKHLGMNQIAELFLFSAARAQLVTQIIKPALAESKIVVCDRYVDSTTAYQGYGRELRLGAVKTINTVATFGLMPKLTIMLDVPVDEMIERKRNAGVLDDRMESGGKAFFERVRSGYLAMAEEEKERFFVVDGTRPVEMIRAEIWDFVSSRLPRSTGA